LKIKKLSDKMYLLSIARRFLKKGYVLTSGMPGGRRELMRILRYGRIVAVALLAAAMGFMSCSRGGKLASISVTPANPTIATGSKQQFKAVATFSDGTAIDWTTAAIWSSSDSAAVTIGNSLGTHGLATSLLSGTTNTITITATDTANNISGSATLYIALPLSIAITPANPYMAINKTHQFKATATLPDLSTGGATTITQDLTSLPTLSWSVDNSADLTTAATSGAGLVTAGTITGTVTITADYLVSSISGTTILTVTDTPLDSITLDPDNTTITQGTTQKFTAKGTFNGTTVDLTSSVTWHSSNTGVATVSNEAGTYGLATALPTGATGTTTTTIRATDPITGISKSTTLNVIP
jgi:hypothetical protein